jgi:hypothetical protein
MEKQRKIHHINFLSLLVLAMLVNILGQATHESGHSLVFQLMGRDPVWGFTKIVQIWDTPPMHPEEWVETSFEGAPGWLKLDSAQESQTEKAIMFVAGPLAGLLGAVVGFVLMRKGKGIATRQAGLAFALSISFAALQYYLRSGNRVGGDEYNLAQLWNISPLFLNISLDAAFAACLVLTLRELPEWHNRLKWLAVVILGSAVTGIMMFKVDDFVIAQVDVGNPWFSPVLGYAFPVFLVNVLALIGCWFWIRHQNIILQQPDT